MNPRKCKVVLIGSDDNIKLFFDHCNTQNEMYKYGGCQTGYETLNRNNIVYEIWYGLGTDLIADADALIYLNADHETKKQFEKYRNSQCPAYDYKSTAFRYALGCIDNIATRKIDADQHFDMKSSLYLSGSKEDKNSLLAILPHEVNTYISVLYAMNCNRYIQRYIPPRNTVLSPMNAGQKIIVSGLSLNNLWTRNAITHTKNEETGKMVRTRAIKRRLDFSS